VEPLLGCSRTDLLRGVLLSTLSCQLLLTSESGRPPACDLSSAGVSLDKGVAEDELKAASEAGNGAEFVEQMWEPLFAWDTERAREPEACDRNAISPPPRASNHASSTESTPIETALGRALRLELAWLEADLRLFSFHEYFEFSPEPASDALMPLTSL